MSAVDCDCAVHQAGIRVVRVIEAWFSPQRLVSLLFVHHSMFCSARFVHSEESIVYSFLDLTTIYTKYVRYVSSAFSAEYGSTGCGCQSCSWSAEQGTFFFSPLSPRSRFRIWSREPCSTLPFRVNPPMLHAQFESGVYPRAHLALIPSVGIGSVPSLSGHTIAYRWRSPPRVHRHRASDPQGRLINECWQVPPF